MSTTVKNLQEWAESHGIKNANTQIIKEETEIPNTIKTGRQIFTNSQGGKNI